MYWLLYEKVVRKVRFIKQGGKMKKRSKAFDNEKWNQLKVKLKKREVWEPVLLILILFLVIGSVIGFSYIGSNTQESEEQNNSKMISELNDINSYLNELDESVTNNKETLESVTENSSISIQEEIVNSKEEINLTIDKGVTELNAKMESLHTKISETETNITDLLAILSLDVEENQQQINSQFSEIKDSLEEIKEEFADMIDEVKELLEQISETQEANHTELKEVLNVMATDMETTATENLDKMMETLTSMEETYTTLLKDYHADTIQNITDLNENMENHFSETNQSIENHFSETNESITNQYMELTTIVNENDDDLSLYLECIFGSINEKLDSVFTFVSDGKKLLASALLTKGVDCAEDASFQTIYEAILSIKQELVIGVEKIPGEIEYEYHYHINGQGEYPHTDKVLPGAAGGCYTVPIYHVHTGNSSSGGGCYSVAKSGTRTVSCGSGYCGVGPYGPDTSGQIYYVGDCDECGGHLSKYGSPGTAHCSNKKTESYTYYELGCGMTPQTIIAYRTGCGLADGQIVGAHILYTGYDELPKADNVSAAIAVYAVEEPTEETTVETVEESTEEVTKSEPDMEMEDETVSESETEMEESTENEPDTEASTETVTEVENTESSVSDNSVNESMESSD